MWVIEVALTEPNCTPTNSPTVVVTRKVKEMNWNFVRCKFHDCNMKVASWGSSFESCEFAGATIDPLFEDVCNAAFSANVVTFVVLTSRVHVGETRHIS